MFHVATQPHIRIARPILALNNTFAFILNKYRFPNWWHTLVEEPMP